MKRLISLVLLLAAVCSASAQEEIRKTGLNFGPLPAVSYSSDLGFQYGALLDIYQYGDGTVYPDYLWKINVEASRYTKGNSVLHAYFDSKSLIRGLRVSADLTYLGNKTTNFYGFNGAASLFVPDLNKIVDGHGFYLMRRDDIRFELTTQGQIGSGTGAGSPASPSTATRRGTPSTRAWISTATIPSTTSMSTTASSRSRKPTAATILTSSSASSTTRATTRTTRPAVPTSRPFFSARRTS